MTGGPPHTDSDHVVAEVWAEVLRLPEVFDDDNFLELGGHSLLATRVLARLRDRLGVHLTADSLLDAADLRQFCDLVAEAGAAATSVQLAVPGDELVLAPTQERLWFVHRIAPQSAAYNIVTVEHLHGPVAVEAFRAALLAVSERHQALRWRFPAPEGRPVVVVDDASAPLRVDDVRHLAPVDRAAAVERITAEEASTPVDIERDTVWRVRLVRLAEDDNVVVFTVHHIAFDGWSVDVLYRDLVRAYGQIVAGRVPTFSPLPADYADYARERQLWLDSPECAEQAAYWRERLAGAPAVLDLPADHARPPVQTYSGAEERTLLPAAAAEGIHRLARRSGVTPFVPMLAGFGLLLGRLAGVDDLVIGTPVAGRPRTEHEDLVGFFVDTVPVRIDLAGAPTGRELVARVGQSLSGALAHQELPFHRLVDELSPPRDPSRNPVVQVLFNAYTFAKADLSLAGTLSESMRPPLPGALFDLTMYVDERDGELQLHLVYNPDLFDRPRMTALLEQFAGVLGALAERPDEASATYSLASDASVAPAGRPSSSATSVPTLLDGLEAGLRRRPVALATVDAERALSHAELDAHADRLAGALRASGVGPGSVVGVWATRTVAIPAALLGVLRAGAAFCVLDPAYPASRLAAQVKIAGIGALVLAGAGNLPESVVQATAGLPVLSALAPEPVSSAAPVPPAPAPAPAAGDAAADDVPPAYVAFTSGTTGRPRGIVGGPEPLAHFFDWYARTFEVGPSDRVAVLSGLAHDPLLRDLLLPVWCGASSHLPPPELLVDPQRLRGWLAQAAVTVVHLTPQMVRLIASGADAAVPLPAIRLVSVGGDIFTDADVAALRRLAPNARIVNGYGATETPQLAAWCEVTDVASPRPAAAPRPVPVGTGAESTRLLVRSAGGTVAGVGELGEVWVESPYLARGYLGDPQVTGERFVAGAYRTGDLGRLLPDGGVVLAGRSDDQVKIRGFRVELAEVAAACTACPDVADAVAVLRHDLGPVPTLVAYLVAAPSAELDVADIARALRRSLPEAAVPASYVVLDRFPLTPNGKVDRAALPAPTADRPSPTTFVKARSEMERTVGAVWQEVLGLSRVGAHDNFFDLGGSSLALVAAHARLQALLGRDIAITDLFRHPTVSTLANHLEHGRAQASMLVNAAARADIRRARQHQRAAVGARRSASRVA